MKKTLAALMALCGVVMGETSDFTSSITTGNAGNGTYYGATIKLTDSFVSTTFSDSSITELPDILTLDAITFYSRTSGSQAGGTVYLAVYKYEADSKTGAFVGLSTNSVQANTLNASLTFNFSDVTSSSKQQYQLLFVNDSSTATNIATFDGYKEHGAGIGLNVLQQSSLPSGDGTYKGTGINDWEGMYIPKVTIATSSVPEPTTAALSLLALAGLAARRRRK